jgi:hypothetical protein
MGQIVGQRTFRSRSGEAREIFRDRGKIRGIIGTNSVGTARYN